MRTTEQRAELRYWYKELVKPGFRSPPEYVKFACSKEGDRILAFCRRHQRLVRKAADAAREGRLK